MTDRGPKARKPSEKTESLEDEARRFLGTPMQDAMIRGLEDEERIKAWLAVGYEMQKNGELGTSKYQAICKRMERR